MTENICKTTSRKRVEYSNDVMVTSENEMLSTKERSVIVCWK